MEDTALTQILDEMEPMLKSLAKKWEHKPRVTIEDLISVGKAAVWRAVETYNPNRTGKDGKVAKLSTHVFTCANNAMQHHFQTNRYVLHSTPYLQKKYREEIKAQDKTIICLDAPMKCNTQGESENYVNVLPAASGSVADLVIIGEEKERLYKEIENLNERERYIIRNSSIYLGNKTLEEIGGELGVTKQCVSQQIKSIVKKLRNKLEDLDENPKKPNAKLNSYASPNRRMRFSSALPVRQASCS